MKTARQSIMWKFQVLAGLGAALVARAQGTAPGSTVVINDSRPLYEAALVLERRYGVSIAYEDAEYTSNDDLDRSRHAVPISRAGTLNVDLSPPLTSPEPLTAAMLLQGLLGQQVRNGNPGQFKLMETAEGLAIIPVAVRNSEGAVVPYRSLLETRITFPEADREAEDTLGLICELTSAASGKKIGLGGGPGVLKWRRVRVGANNEIARDVLARMLTSLHAEGEPGSPNKSPGSYGYKISWSLLTTKTPGIDALLFLRQVTVDQPGPGGTVVRAPVPR
jgi:hypothetical protein